jgi:hypothetical protein
VQCEHTTPRLARGQRYCNYETWTLPRCQFKDWFLPASYFLYLNSLSPGRQLDVRHLKHIRGMLRRNYRLASPWKERHSPPQQPATCQIKLIWVIWQAKLLADSVHLHHIPTDSISVCNSHAAVPMRTIISRKIIFVCKILKIFPSTYKSHVMNRGACGWITATAHLQEQKQTTNQNITKAGMHTCPL